MDFSTHLQKLIESLDMAMKKKRRGLVNDFRYILSTAGTLLRTNEFDYWLNQIGTIKIEELPVTHYGLKEARGIVCLLAPVDRLSFKASLLAICESLFTYSSDNDMCVMQSDFHYYMHIENLSLVRISELGCVDPNIENLNQADLRIATISELGKNHDEFIAV